MCSPGERFCLTLKDMQFFPTKRLGLFSYNELKILTDETAIREGRLEKIEVEHLYDDLDTDKFDVVIKMFNGCIELCTAMDNFITEKVGKINNISRFNQFIDFFKDFIKLFKKCDDSEESSALEGSYNESGENSNVPSKKASVHSIGVNGGRTVNSREDVAKVLKELTGWYKKFDKVSMDLFILEAVIKSMESDDFETAAEALKAVAAKINKVFGVSIATQTEPKAEIKKASNNTEKKETEENNTGSEKTHDVYGKAGDLTGNSNVF